MIFVTPFDPETKQPIAPSADSGYADLAELDTDPSVSLWYGPALAIGKRTRTYAGMFFSDYPLTAPSNSR